MKCLACDVILTDFEATRRYENGTFIDLCNHCFFAGVDEQIFASEREDLMSENDTELLTEDYFDAEAV